MARVTCTCGCGTYLTALVHEHELEMVVPRKEDEEPSDRFLSMYLDANGIVALMRELQVMLVHLATNID